MQTPKWDRIDKIEDLGDFVEVRVDYYEKIDWEEIKKRLPGMAEIVPEKGATIRISRADFLTYWLFEGKNPDDPLYSSFRAISKRTNDAIPDLWTDFQRSGEDLRALPKRKGTERSTDIPTRLGVAVGLSLISQGLGMTEADWTKIGKTYKDKKEEPRLDYELAATPVGYVAVENKGAINDDNSKKTPSVSASKADILKKKEAAHKDADANGNKCTLVGTIAVADSRDDSKLKCWLLDPPEPFVPQLWPAVYRIVTRLAFYGRMLRVIFPVWHSLHRAVDKRIEAIRQVNKWESFHGKMLTGVSSQAFKFKWDAKIKPQAATPLGLLVGIIGKCGSDHLLFVGLSKQCVDIVAKQDLVRLSSLRSPSQSTKSILRWSPSRPEKGLLDKVEMKPNQDGSVEVPVTIHQTGSGFSFALIPFKSKDGI